MKTLDEVIWAMEWRTELYQSGCGACPYADDDDLRCYADDALHYLKKLKRIEERMERIALGNIEDALSKMDNPPLTWDKLREMEDKPVFVEERYRNGDLKSSGWWLIDFWNDDQICLRDQGGNPWNAYRESIERDWQAYRKERK